MLKITIITTTKQKQLKQTCYNYPRKATSANQIRIKNFRLPENKAVDILFPC